MLEFTYLILLIFLSYLTGSIPTSIIMGRMKKGIDIREYGSGNAGGTNVFRIMGWKPALVVIIVDIFKGWLPVAVFAPLFINLQSIPDLGVIQILCGFSSVIGHTYTIFSGFKGGKGAACGVGVLAAIAPVVMGIIFILSVTLISLFRYVAPVTILSSLLTPILLWFFGSPIEYVVSVGLVCLFIIYRHRANISRLIQGKENKI